ncbi:MAG: type II toxin-antitoxin system death-on-curing family toxin [Planctomycetota bacterium]
MADGIRFLSVDDVLAIQEDTIRHDGGLAGVRDPGLLESAVTMPRQAIGGEYLHPDLAAMAAAYLYHIAQNHPFHDGNKRAGAMAALVFLRVNGVETLPDQHEMEKTTLRVAGGEMVKAELTQWLREATAESS